ncbi:j domain-containing protein CG6693 [Caerostris darwini]|uniref:J domain-containing protein CG6693 n=1 Tax=Caerostris darwini TaxID=1538125 RepID=A0AAV4U3H9_9ARAC|nr:j domain-containing protein CG6693 [Caerostris darwini]
MGLFEDCEVYFGVKSLYEVLAVEKTAKAIEIKKAYRQLSLVLHPDKAAEDRKVEYTRKFQILSKVHCILSDSEKRQVYDETGIVDDENISTDDSDPEFWMNYWRALFPRVKLADVAKFFEKYKASKQEKEDLKEAYIKVEGDMDVLPEYFIGYKVEEEDKIVAVLEEMIQNSEIPSFPKFLLDTPAKKAARKIKFQKEAAEVEEMAASGELAAIINKSRANRESNFNDMISRMENKYGKKKVVEEKK